MSRYSHGCALACLMGCSPAPSSLVEVRDPEGIAQNAVEIQFAVRDARGQLAGEGRRKMDRLPATITIASPSELELEVGAEALDASGQVIARGYVDTNTTLAGTPAQLNLGAPCDGDCDDGLFCNGEERCERGVCRRSPEPCQASFACVLGSCVEASDECSTTVEHSLCDAGDGISRYCSPNSGCVEGAPCTEDNECQDGLACNGQERCVNFTCAGGPPPNPDDGNPCTVDGCNDANTLEAVFSLPDATKDGNTCDLATGGLGICLSTSAAVCVESACGDGFHDPFREACDDGNDDSTDGCTQTCELPRCGDGHRQASEVCDDGNTIAGDGCRADCLKIEVCGDGALDQGEACDDGNNNPNDDCHQCRTTRWLASVVSGFGEATDDPLNISMNPVSATLDRQGNMFVADAKNHRIWRIDAQTGFPTVVAGTGTEGDSGDGGPATSAELSYPLDVAVDGLGNLYIADTLNHRIRQVCAGDSTCPTGWIRTIAGTGSDGFSGDGGPATLAELSHPSGIAVDGLGNLFVADEYNNAVREICVGNSSCESGSIRTVAGTGTYGYSGDGGPAIAAQLNWPSDVEVDNLGNLFVADKNNHSIRQICVGDPSCSAGSIRTVAGNGSSGFSGDGGPATSAELSFPHGLTIDRLGNLWIADTWNRRVREVCVGDPSCPAGTIRTVAGMETWGFSGDGGLAHLAELNHPGGVVADLRGNLWIADTGNERVRQVCAGDSGCPAGLIRTVAGTGSQSFSGDGALATSAAVTPTAIAVDDLGNVFIADSSHHRVRQVCVGDSSCPAGTIRTVAGTGTPGRSVDGIPAALAEINFPSGVAIDSQGNLFIADTINGLIRQVCATDSICPAGTIRTIAGGGLGPRGSGDGGPATSASLWWPRDLAVDHQGNVFFAEPVGHRIRQVCAGDPSCPAGFIRTVAGTGVAGFSGDGGPANQAQLNRPNAIAADGVGNLWIADSNNNRIRQVCIGDPTCSAGTIRTVASSGTGSQSSPPTSGDLYSPTGVAVDRLGNVLISSGSNRILKLCAGDPTCPSGSIQTLAGNGVRDTLGDGGPATDAALHPGALAVDALGNVFFGDQSGRIREVCAGDASCPSGFVRTIAGYVDPTDGPLIRSALEEPFALAQFGTQWLVADGVSGRVRLLDERQNSLSTVVGYPSGFSEEGALARHSRLLRRPLGIAVDSAHNLFFVGESEQDSIRVVNTSHQPWTISTVPTTDLSSPSGLLFDGQANRLLVADRENHVIRAVDVDNGATTLLVGTLRTKGFSGDGRPATDALLNAPESLGFGPDGSLYIADTGNNRVRRVDTSGIIDTVLGDGTASSSGEGAPARFFPVNAPLGLATDSHGNLFVSSSTTLRRVHSGEDGIATGDDFVGTIYGSAPRTLFPSSVTNCLTGLALTDAADGTPESRIVALDACAGFALSLERNFN